MEKTMTEGVRSPAAALVFCHGAIVVGDVRGELARAVAARDEIQIRRGRRMQYRIERSLARQSDRRRRQALARVGVEGLIAIEIAPRQVAVELSTDAVDDRRIGLQLHTLTQPVHEYGRDQRT